MRACTRALLTTSLELFVCPRSSLSPASVQTLAVDSSTDLFVISVLFVYFFNNFFFVHFLCIYLDVSLFYVSAMSREFVAHLLEFSPRSSPCLIRLTLFLFQTRLRSVSLVSFAGAAVP